jgi:hypothetical protein
MHVYQNINDNTKIQFLTKQTHFQKANVNGKLVMVKLKEDILKFKYIEAAEIKYLEHQSKLGKEVEFKRSEFERLVKQKMFVKC